ncbi:MAG TPA: serine hydrolase [Candidatus Paceibacterota bacterium]|nr:serine hydrolase [Candidatus Paceibacterota bacterium]
MTGSKSGPKKLMALSGILIFLMGLLMGFFLLPLFFPRQLPVSQSIRLSDPKNKLISPFLLSADSPTTEDFQLEDHLRLASYDSLNTSGFEAISIYFRDLKSGIWATVNSEAQYDPASLYKVPVMIAWFKEAETKPNILNQKILYEGGPLDNKGLAFNTLTPGTYYTINDLIKIMIEKSDNDADDILETSLGTTTLDQIFVDLNIPLPDSSLQVTAKDYGRFFRLLYNSTYLNEDYSERALELLASTDFNSGLVAGVPAGITVAHKYGQYQDQAGTRRELHDCGIIYHSTNPYLLCVMTKGDATVNNSIFESAIRNISSVVYDVVDNHQFNIPKPQT